MRNLNCNILSGIDTESVTGERIDANQIISASFQAVFGDVTAVGVFKIQASNDIDNTQGTAFSPVNWTDIPNATIPITAGGNALIVIPIMAFRSIRAVFLYTSGGDSTVSVNIFAL